MKEPRTNVVRGSCYLKGRDQISNILSYSIRQGLDPLSCVWFKIFLKKIVLQALSSFLIVWASLAL